MTAIADTRRMAETRSGSGRSPSGGGAPKSAIAQKLPPKHPGPRITAKRYDAITAAIRDYPDALPQIAAQFDLGLDTIKRMARLER